VLGPDTPVEHDPDLVALLTSGTTRQRILETLGPRVRGDLRAWRRMAATVLRRDRAMSRALRRDRARLSSALVQPELFSHRATRSLAPQLYVLDESISRLREASAEMRAVGHVSLESITPLFAGMLPKPWQT
jgi:hypothetical protein